MVMDEPMMHLLYQSVSRIDRTASEWVSQLGGLLQQCLTNNPAHRITGVLGFRDCFFTQLLEGPDAEVWSLYRRVLTDPRHSQVCLEMCAPAAERLLPGWSMAYVGNMQELTALLAPAPADKPCLQVDVVRRMASLIA